MDSKKPEEEEGEMLLSCWGSLKLKFRRTRGRRNTKGRLRRVGWKILDAFKPKRPRPFSSFRYDPLSYSQNFDDSCWAEDCEGYLHRGFSARFAAPSSKPSEV